MNKRKYYIAIPVIAAALAGCTPSTRIANIERSRILIDSRYDNNTDTELTKFLAPYKQKVDSMMSPVAGRAAQHLQAGRPESKLSNLLADILIWGGKAFNERPDFAVYNIGGIRASLAKGDITYGNVLDVAPFENKICFVTMSGKDVMELFKQIATVGGEGISHGVNLKITEKGTLNNATLNGKPINPDASYRIATIDYLAQGNDNMEAFKKATNANMPEGETNNVREIIINYMKEMTAKGMEINSEIEGRIVIE